MLSIQSGSSDNIAVYKIEEKLTEEEHKQMAADLDERIKQHGTVHLLVDIPETPKLESGTFSDHFTFVKEHKLQIGRFAMISESSVVRSVAKIYDAVTNIDFQNFGEDERDKARIWIEEASAAS
ncbi:STAS/SEC14 domain-containing protein [Alkalicoccus chagannorensis]|uniref:STAS/SEC14 domain-containing protein n=1 Tax=Alkalicoccus chagannorensis TaxID=427072 RepID=UPI00040EFE5C|nr:STAS/SEC14 domain-containing protein [Alkalicoccus chagannorensis]